MAVATQYGTTPWSTFALGQLYGVAGSRAKKKQDELEQWIVEVLAPVYVARGVRADQACASIRAWVGRLHRLFESGDERVVQHVIHLIKVAGDKADTAALESAGKRLPSGRPAPKRPAQRQGRRVG